MEDMRCFMNPKEIPWDTISSIIDKHKEASWALIPLLQDVQEALGYIPPEIIPRVAAALFLHPSEVQGVITFYSGFSTVPKGRHVFRVCRGTACHVKGGSSILRHMKKELRLEEGETSEDYQFSLETVACLGACFLAPTMMADKEYVGRLTPQKATSVINHHRKEDE